MARAAGGRDCVHPRARAGDQPRAPSAGAIACAKMGASQATGTDRQPTRKVLRSQAAWVSARTHVALTH